MSIDYQIGTEQLSNINSQGSHFCTVIGNICYVTCYGLKWHYMHGSHVLFSYSSFDICLMLIDSSSSSPIAVFFL
jgi:hypothetical protein